jgi:Na+-translocating ferredoxin:NAD+ oxidoreductase RnfG subunit
LLCCASDAGARRPGPKRRLRQTIAGDGILARMSFDIRWLAPAAIFAIPVPQCVAAQYMTLQQAQGLIYAQADQFVPAAVTLSPEQVAAVEARSRVKLRAPKQQVWEARAKGKQIGWFFVDQVIGKHELITYAAGIDLDGKLRQFQIVEYREIQGYQVRELAWRDQFVGKTVDDPLEVGVDIRNISGATLSCHHVAEGLRRLLALHETVLR